MSVSGGIRVRAKEVRMKVSARGSQQARPGVQSELGLG